MSLFDELISRRANLSLIGLGYVDMPIAVAFAKKINVIGYDLNEAIINLYISGIDSTIEVGNDIKATTVEFTADETQPGRAKFHIVNVRRRLKDWLFSRA